MAQRSISGIKETDLLLLVHELFDEEYSKEVLETLVEAKFVRNGKQYYGTITTGKVVFFVVCVKEAKGWQVLRFDFEELN